MDVDPPSRNAPFPGGIKRIAVEEAFVTPEIVERWRRMLDTNSGDIEPGFKALMGFFLYADTPFTTSVMERLLDLGEKRIGDMDAAGIDTQVLSLTSPGVHVFDADTATALAAESNDRLAETIAQHPERFGGLATVAPQNPAAAAREIERGFNNLGLRGVIINSHVNGAYLHDRKYWEIFEAAEALDAPVYVHPNTPSAGMLEPYLPELYGAILGFAADTGLHLLRLILSGLFDRFPNLKMVAGHLGEALPFWMYRFDFAHPGIVQSGDAPALNKKPSDYLKENFHYTTSGMPWEPMISLVHRLVGPDRLLYAMDYPYQYIPEEVDMVDALPFGEEEMRKFYQTNAERLFRLSQVDSARVQRDDASFTRIRHGQAAQRPLKAGSF